MQLKFNSLLPCQQPFVATRNNNIKDRKNRDFVAFSISIIAHPEINFSGLELLSAQVDSSLLSVITLVTVSGQQQRINQAQTALFKLADKPGNDVEQLDPLTYKNTRVSLSDTL